MKEGYFMLVSPRTGGKKDGCCMLVRSELLTQPPTVETLSFEDWGNRILQLVTLSVAGAAGPLTLAHTHLTYPHDNGHDPTMRWHQARKMANLVRGRQRTSAVAVFGDLNGDVHDPAVSALLENAGLTPMASDAEWVSHVSHTGAQMACDIVATSDGTGSGGASATCRVGSWQLGGSKEELLMGTGLSDHRPLGATLLLKPQ